MRTDNAEFSSYNKSQYRQPSFVVEVAFDSANTDLIYLTFDTISGLSGANVINGVLESISGTTQKINPDKALSTIGAMSFSAVDDGLTDTQKSKLAAGYGLRGKRVRFYVGAQGLAWSAFVLTQTQVIETVDYQDGVYSFTCSDIQREMRVDIFDVKKTALKEPLSSSDTTITVYNTSQFQTVKHPASPTGLIHRGNEKVGYLKIEVNGETEIICYTGKTATEFTGCERGVLGTKPLDVAVNVGTVEQSAPKVEEYVYLAMPAPMIAYAVLTGSIYGYPGEYLPDHWHLGISTNYVKTSDFTNIGVDWWDTTNADKGIVLGIAGVQKQDGKKFLEEQIYRLLGAFSPIYSTGELGLKRLSVVHSSGGYVATLDESNVVKYSALTHDMKSVINKIAIGWNWVESKQDYTRYNILIDQDSIDAHGEGELLELKLRGLSGVMKHSRTTLESRFDSLRDRYAGPPLRLQLTLTPDMNALEVGDIVRVNLNHVKDYTGTTAGGELARNFEVQQVSTDWVSGDVKVSLFGSSQKAGAIVPDEVGTPIDSAFFYSEGTEINAANFPGNVSSAGGITTISGNITLTGNADLTNSAAIYYCNEDLTINSGVVVTTTLNTQIRVNGFFQINGAIDAKGRGFAGSVYPDTSPAARFIGTSISQPSVGLADAGTAALFHHSGYTSKGLNSVFPKLTLEIDGDTISGVPQDLTGQPGACGGYLSVGYEATGITIIGGGNGGNGGGGVMVASIGAGFGPSGYIDTSGGDGANGSSHTWGTRTYYSGKGGGGAPGGILFIITDENATPPSIDGSNIRCYYGSSDASGYSTLVDIKTIDRPKVYDLPAGVFSFFRGPTAFFDLVFASEPSPDHTANIASVCYKPLVLAGFVDSVTDTPDQAADVLSFTLTEYPNTPPSQGANISTIEVSVTGPSDPNYSYAFIQYKNELNSPWLDAGPASPEGAWQVPSDGKTYYVRALSVSTSGVMSPTGPQDSITVTDVINDPDTTAPTVLTFAPITVFLESGTAVFTGKDAKFYWNDDAALKSYFLSYKVEIIDTSLNVMRTETVIDPFFVYTYEKNKEDYYSFHATNGANRAFTIRVTVLGRVAVTGGQYEGPTYSLAVSNTAPSAPGSLALSAGYGVIYITGTNPTDLDFTKFGIYISTSPGFTPGPSNFLGYTNQLPITIGTDASGAKLSDGGDYYVVIESWDEFGAGGQTTDYHLVMLGIPAGTEIPVSEVLTVDGRIIADASGDPYRVTLGPHVTSARASLFSFKNTTTGTPYFTLFEDGEVAINGKITIAAGSSGISSFSDAGALATQNSVDYSAVSGDKPPTDATNGATWGSNLSGIPARVAGTAGVSGLYLTDTHLGFWNGSAWKTWMQNNGSFYLAGAGANSLSWNGTSLDIVGTITGSTFRTSPTESDKRVELRSSDNTFVFYDSSGIERVRIDNADTVNGHIRVSAAAGKSGISSSSAGVAVSATGAINGSIAVDAQSNSGSSSIGVRAASSTGIALEALTTGGKGVKITATGSAAGLEASSVSGIAVKGAASGGNAGHFTNSSSSPTVFVDNNSSGPAVSADSSTGYGVIAYSAGAGYAALYGVGSGGTVGVAGTSLNGRGVQGIGTGAGSIGLYGQGVAYGAYIVGAIYSFTGAHDCLLLNGDAAPEVGDIVETVSIVNKASVSDTTPRVRLADTVESKKCYGVFVRAVDFPAYEVGAATPILVAGLSNLTQVAYESIASAYTLLGVNGVGEGQINVCDDNGDIEVGDFISTSATPGKGQLYTGSDMRVVVAKALEPVDWSAETETTKMIACVYLCS